MHHATPEEQQGLRAVLDDCIDRDAADSRAGLHLWPLVSFRPRLPDDECT